jgi:hypothetical protein
MVRHRHRNIVVDISGHGFGHLGQITPVIQAMLARRPEARIVVRSAHEGTLVREFIGAAIEVDRPPPEVTLSMRGPTVVDAAASAEAYRVLHANWEDHVDREAARLAALAPAALIADIPYLSLAAAKRIGVPAIALCSLNWADIYRTYCGDARDAAAILGTMESAYASADIFLQPQPHMPMAAFPNRRSIGPIARIGRSRHDEMRTALGIPRDHSIVLVSLGGIPAERRVSLPEISGIHWLIGPALVAPRGSATDVSRLGMPFIDVLASSDAVVTKVGYCMFVEAVCNGVGLVSARRDDWPEASPLVEWAKRNGRFALAEPCIEDVQGLQVAVEAVLTAQCQAAPSASGAAEASDAISDLAGLPLEAHSVV